MGGLKWELSVLASRWKNRFRYVLAAPSTYRNWWVLPLPKLGISVVLELRNGLQYLVRAGHTDLAVVNEATILNPYLTTEYIRISEESTIVDVGANIGDFTVQVAKRCPRGRVIAVEPLHDHVRMIGIQAQLNGLENIVCVQAALGGTEGQIEIHVGGGQSSAYWGGASIQNARLTTLSQVMQETGIEEISLLKLDCEGAEWEILPAAEKVLPRIRQICMEFHCVPGWTPERLAEWLRDREYKVWHTTGSWNGLLWAVRQ